MTATAVGDDLAERVAKLGEELGRAQTAAAEAHAAAEGARVAHEAALREARFVEADRHRVELDRLEDEAARADRAVESVTAAVRDVEDERQRADWRRQRDRLVEQVDSSKLLARQHLEAALESMTETRASLQAAVAAEETARTLAGHLHAVRISLGDIPADTQFVILDVPVANAVGSDRLLAAMLTGRLS